MRYLLCLGLLWLCGSSYAQSDWALLRKATLAGRELSLTGVYFHQSSDGTETAEMIRTRHGKRVLVKRKALDGMVREIVQDGEDLTVYGTDMKSLYLARVNTIRPFPGLWPEEKIDVSQSYTIQRKGSALVAQRSCTILELMPKVPGRYKLNICVDKQTHIPLRVMSFSAKGGMVEQFAFTKITPSSSKNKQLYQSKLPEKLFLRPISQSQIKGNIAQYRVSGMAKGLQLIQSKLRPMGGLGEPKRIVRHMLYSDGIVMLSLFIEPKSVYSVPNRSKTVYGAVSIANFQQGPYQLTAVGDISADALLVLLKNLRVQVES